VFEAGDGAEGLESVVASAPSLILLDLMMPGMDGFEFLEKLEQSATGRDIPVVVITGKALGPEDKERLSRHVEQVLQKGAYHRDELLARIRALVQRSMPGKTDRRDPGQARSQRRSAGIDNSRPAAGKAQADEMTDTGEGGSPEGREGVEGAGQALPPFDLRELMERIDDDKELLSHLLSIYFRDCPRMVDEIDSALSAGDASALNAAAHSIKGMLATLGAHAASRLALQLEVRGRDAQLDGASRVLEQLRAALGELDLALHALEAADSVASDD
jgi:CheY-like chemotaxis protein/HPt (histidine-containing phosphotransfer) domain-containing protein